MKASVEQRLTMVTVYVTNVNQNTLKIKSKA